MPDNRVQIRVAADLAEANEAMEKFGATSSGALEQAIANTKPFNDSLLSGRESARLLTEELGVHMPRAVTSAISEMLPAISALGPAMLGAFALMEIPKLIDGLKEARDWMSGFGAEAKAAFAEAVKASDDAMVHFKTIKQGISLRHEVNANIAALTIQRDLLDNTGGSMVNYAKAAAAMLSGNMAQAIAYEKIARLQQIDMKELARLEAERLQQLDQEDKLEKEANKSSAERTEHIRREGMTIREWHREMIKAGQEAGKVAKEIASANEEATASVIRRAKADLEFTLNLEKLGVVEQKNLSNLKQYTPAAHTATTATKHMSDAHKVLIGVDQELKKVKEALSAALHGETDAMIAGTNALSGIVDNLTALIGNTKASAEIRGAYDAALAIEWWARFAASYGTDAQAAVTATEYTLAAAEMFKVAGSGNRAAQRGGGGGGGSAGMQGGRGSPEAAGAMGTETPITPGFTSVGGGGGNIVVHVYGANQEATHIASVLNNYTTRQGGSLVATRSLAPPRAGR
jgi:hypothetical protein